MNFSGPLKPLEISPHMKSMTIFITEMKTSTTFWFQRKGPSYHEAVEKMHVEMAEVYNGKSASDSVLTLDQLVPGMPVAAKYFDSGFNRGEVMSVDEKTGNVKIFFCDFGSECEVKVEDVRRLYAKFGKLLKQAVQGRLWGLKFEPTNDTAYNKVTEIVGQNKEGFSASVKAKFVGKKQELPIAMYLKCNDTKTTFNQELVRQEICSWSMEYYSNANSLVNKKLFQEREFVYQLKCEFVEGSSLWNFFNKKQLAAEDRILEAMGQSITYFSSEDVSSVVSASTDYASVASDDQDAKSSIVSHGGDTQETKKVAPCLKKPTPAKKHSLEDIESKKDMKSQNEISDKTTKKTVEKLDLTKAFDPDPAPRLKDKSRVKFSNAVKTIIDSKEKKYTGKLVVTRTNPRERKAQKWKTSSEKQDDTFDPNGDDFFHASTPFGMRASNYSNNCNKSSRDSHRKLKAFLMMKKSQKMEGEANVLQEGKDQKATESSGKSSEFSSEIDQQLGDSGYHSSCKVVSESDLECLQDKVAIATSITSTDTLESDNSTMNHDTCTTKAPVKKLFPAMETVDDSTIDHDTENTKAPVKKLFQASEKVDTTSKPPIMPASKLNEESAKAKEPHETSHLPSKPSLIIQPAKLQNPSNQNTEPKTTRVHRFINDECSPLDKVGKGVKLKKRKSVTFDTVTDVTYSVDNLDFSDNEGLVKSEAFDETDEIFYSDEENSSNDYARPTLEARNVYVWEIDDNKLLPFVYGWKGIWVHPAHVSNLIVQWSNNNMLEKMLKASGAMDNMTMLDLTEEDPDIDEYLLNLVEEKLYPSICLDPEKISKVLLSMADLPFIFENFIQDKDERDVMSKSVCDFMVAFWPQETFL